MCGVNSDTKCWQLASPTWEQSHLSHCNPMQPSALMAKVWLCRYLDSFICHCFLRYKGFDFKIFSIDCNMFPWHGLSHAATAKHHTTSCTKYFHPLPPSVRWSHVVRMQWEGDFKTLNELDRFVLTKAVSSRGWKLCGRISGYCYIGVWSIILLSHTSPDPRPNPTSERSDEVHTTLTLSLLRLLYRILLVSTSVSRSCPRFKFPFGIIKFRKHDIFLVIQNSRLVPIIDK